MAKLQYVEHFPAYRSDTMQTYEHISRLNYGMAIIYETLRMFPIVGGQCFIDLSGCNFSPGP